MGNCVGGKGAKKDPKVLTEEEIQLLLNNTRLTRQQIIALHRNFINECPTGKLTKKDFVKLFKEVHPSDNKKEKADKFCEYVFKVIDQEKLGYISFQDFVLCFSLTSDGDFRQKCEFAFKLYDLDKDGKISKKEMTQVLTALYDLSGITDRKGPRAPAKKVDDIMRKINQTYQPVVETTTTTIGLDGVHTTTTTSAAPADGKKAKKEKPPKKEKPVKPPKEPKKAKEPKPPKPGKEPKPPKEKKEKVVKVKVAKAPKQPKGPEFITKDQFIDACSADEEIKKLFVDSIFSNTTELTEHGIELKADHHGHLHHAHNEGPVSLNNTANSVHYELNRELPSVQLTKNNRAPQPQAGQQGPILVALGPDHSLNLVTSTTRVDLNDEVQPPVTTTTTTTRSEKESEDGNVHTTTTVVESHSESADNTNNVTSKTVEYQLNSTEVVDALINAVNDDKKEEEKHHQNQ